MRLWLERFAFGHDSTLGELALHEDGMEPSVLCYTIEDERRMVKVPGETAIPVGVYPIIFRTEGGLHEKYKARFPEMHQGMLHITPVPDFAYIMLHCGNHESETDGCPLVVTSPSVTQHGEFFGGQSVDAYKRLYPLVAAALNEGEVVTLTVSERGPS